MPTAPNGGGPYFVMVDATYVYWAETGNTPFPRRVPLAGGTVEDILGLDEPVQTTLVGKDMYFLDDPGSKMGTLRRG